MHKLDAKFHASTQEMKGAIQRLEVDNKASKAAIHNLKVQFGQMAQYMSGRAPGKLPSSTEANPKENAMAITLRSGKQLDDPVSLQPKQVIEDDVVVEKELPRHSSENGESSKGKSICVEEDVKTPPPPEVKAYVPPLPFPQRQRYQRNETNLNKFLDVFKKTTNQYPFS